MPDASRYVRIVIDRYRYRNFHGCQSHCGLEIVRMQCGKTAVIATELADNPGTSVTNVCEYLASWVCVEFQIDPSSLVWVEHYGYPDPVSPKRPRTFDLVTFEILPPGHDAVFAHPRWRPMKDDDWRELGLPVRS